MKEKLLPVLCLLGFHRYKPRIRPVKWRWCLRCNHIFFDRPTS